VLPHGEFRNPHTRAPHCPGGTRWHVAGTRNRDRGHTRRAANIHQAECPPRHSRSALPPGSPATAPPAQFQPQSDAKDPVRPVSGRKSDFRVQKTCLIPGYCKSLPAHHSKYTAHNHFHPEAAVCLMTIYLGTNEMCYDKLLLAAKAIRKVSFTGIIAIQRPFRVITSTALPGQVRKQKGQQ